MIPGKVTWDRQDPPVHPRLKLYLQGLIGQLGRTEQVVECCNYVSLGKKQGYQTYLVG